MTCPCHGLPLTVKGMCRAEKRAIDRAQLLTPRGRARQRKFRLREQLSRGRTRLQRIEEALA